MLLWITVLAMGVVTYFVRAAPIHLLGRLQLPPLVLRALRYVPGAVLSAIVFPELLLREGALAISPGNPRLLAGILAGLVAWRTRNMLLTIVVGMAALWGATALLG
jgi:branched-subunit amino acid transport protein